MMKFDIGIVLPKRHQGIGPGRSFYYTTRGVMQRGIYGRLLRGIVGLWNPLACRIWGHDDILRGIEERLECVDCGKRLS